MIHTWQTQQWQHLQHARAENRLPHALLFKGAAGVGKFNFAMQFTKSLLCLTPKEGGYACDVCHGCRQAQGNVHPDMLYVQPEKEGQAIKIDQIRALSEFISQTSLQCGKRIAIIAPAQAMNINAANGLLKTLEEPAKDALLILVSDQPARLPATILSRCQDVHFPSPSLAEAKEWLQAQKLETDHDLELLLRLADGAPHHVVKLLATDMLTVRDKLYSGLSNVGTSAIKLSEALHGHDPIQLIDFYLAWLSDLLRLALGVAVSRITNTDYTDQLSTLANKGQSEKLTALIVYAQHIRKVLCDGIHLNKQLLLEDLFMRWNRYVAISR